MSNSRNILERRSFPRVPVTTILNAHLRHRDQHLTAEVGDISASGMRVRVEKPWPEGTIVDFEFTLMDDVRPFVGRAEVVHVKGDECRGNGGSCMGLRFLFVRAKTLTAKEMARYALHMQVMNLEQAVNVLLYAWGEIHGNLVESREFGEPSAGFRQPVLLIHGWLGTRGVLRFLERRLKLEGFPVLSIDLGLLNVSSIEKSSELLTAKVAKLSARMGGVRINALAHSMGGLIALWGLKKLDLGKYVNRLIAVGSPFHGTYMTVPGLALFAPFYKTLWQMTPGSTFLNELNEGPLPADVEIHCVAAREDFFVTPDSATLAGAHNLLIEGGHASLITGRGAINKILALLEKRNPFTPSFD